MLVLVGQLTRSVYISPFIPRTVRALSPPGRNSSKALVLPRGPSDGLSVYRKTCIQRCAYTPLWKSRISFFFFLLHFLFLTFHSISVFVNETKKDLTHRRQWPILEWILTILLRFPSNIFPSLTLVKIGESAVKLKLRINFHGRSSNNLFEFGEGSRFYRSCTLPAPVERILNTFP